MTRRMAAAALLFSAGMLAACNEEPSPYRKVGNPPPQNPGGTPADRTGGARNAEDDGAGGGPGKNSWPADSLR